ncbi:hypothetical protein, conserved [Trypanosoma brucei gambiense DAL972]|uniref:Uncharacterized protein n=1 Tax=Trypanosoma brucei gambiense (strain MHOM/CI/86/DAL972) TaxID=679716 RepID=C9ZWA5_TRYB9|nr:hypothetical protein, conserved [Trypanosoma brucei gambiense DAL972]CBH13694.1 hypothetical protein, conserved [Trypanosoma brucei gambiense DAL972]|eukprot:XP_011775970.1 hypothetical protein, conserved [Trypanosoma brucei gambiense DAL972]
MIEVVKSTTNADRSVDNQKEVMSVDGASEVERERVSQLLEENMRLRAKQSQLQDQLADLKRQLISERSERQGLDVELDDVKKSLRLTRDQLDQHKREKSELSLKLCTMTAERDELEEKLSEAWSNVANLQESANAKEAINKSLQDTIHRERREQDAQKVLMQAMVSQLSTLEQQVITGACAEEQQRQTSDEVWRATEEEVFRFSSILEELADSLTFSGSFGPSVDRCRELLQLQPRPANGESMAAADIVCDQDGLNISHGDEPSQRVNGRLFAPAYYALRYLHQKLQEQRNEFFASQQEQRVLEAHVSSLKEEINQVSRDGDGVRERLMKSEAQRARAEALLQDSRQTRDEEVAQALETRRRLAKLLKCMDDWFMIEHCISDSLQEVIQLRQAVEENRRLHEQYVMRKEEEMDCLIETHQREMDEQRGQLEQIRRECERHKRAAASTTPSMFVPSPIPLSTGSTGDDSTVMELVRERDALKVKYDDLQRYVETELEPLMAEQDKAMQREKQRVEELCRLSAEMKLEMKLFRGVCKVCSRNTDGEAEERVMSTFEALVLTLRVLSGARKDEQEMMQQRKALLQYISEYERRFGTLNSITESTRLRPLRYFRRAVVAVIAVNRLAATYRTSWQHSCGNSLNIPLGDTIVPVTVRSTGPQRPMRIRLPRETRCIAHGGLMHIPLQNVINTASEEEVTQRLESECQAIFVTEQELWQVMRPPHVPRTVVGEVALQSYKLRSLVDSLMLFITVPTAPQLVPDPIPLLWQGLERGLSALRATPRECPTLKEEQQRLFHTPQLSVRRGDDKSPHSCSWLNDDAVTPNQMMFSSEEWLYGGNRDGHAQANIATVPVLSPSYILGNGGLGGALSGNGPSAYPVPQINDECTHDDETLEDAVRQSLMRDVYECNGLREDQLGEGFAAHILNVIQALDQRVMGALERRSKVGERRPYR